MGCSSSNNASIHHNIEIESENENLTIEKVHNDDLGLALLSIAICKIAESAVDKGKLQNADHFIKGWNLTEIEEWVTIPKDDDKILCKAMTGCLSSSTNPLLFKIPFVCFSMNVPQTLYRNIFSKLMKFSTSNMTPIGNASQLCIDKYEDVRSLGLLEWLTSAAKGKSQCLIVGHGFGGCLASLFGAELLTDYAVDVEDKVLLHEKSSSTMDCVMDFDDNNEFSPNVEPKLTAPSPSANIRNETAEQVNNYRPSNALPPVRLLTFGAPRVFHINALNHLKKHPALSGFTRYINKGDLLPTEQGPYSTLAHLAEGACFRNFHQGWQRHRGYFDFEGDHSSTAVALSMTNNSLDAYAHNIEECMEDPIKG